MCPTTATNEMMSVSVANSCDLKPSSFLSPSRKMRPCANSVTASAVLIASLSQSPNGYVPPKLSTHKLASGGSQSSAYEKSANSEMSATITASVREIHFELR